MSKRRNVGDIVTPVAGRCCSCGYDGDLNEACAAREDGSHCHHWWDGPDVPDRVEMPEPSDRGLY